MNDTEQPNNSSIYEKAQQFHQDFNEPKNGVLDYIIKAMNSKKTSL